MGAGGGRPRDFGKICTLCQNPPKWHFSNCIFQKFGAFGAMKSDISLIFERKKCKIFGATRRMVKNNVIFQKFSALRAGRGKNHVIFKIFRRYAPEDAKKNDYFFPRARVRPRPGGASPPREKFTSPPMYTVYTVYTPYIQYMYILHL